jgi:uncharacterized membrane protein
MPGKRATVTGAKANNLLFTGAILGLIVIVVLVSVLLRSQTFVKASTHQPEAFTELYFSNSTNLPSYITEGSNLPIDFTVHNEEAKNMNYTFDVSVTAPSATTATSISESKFTLANNASQNFKASYVMPKNTGRYEITVSLVGQPETIHMWVEARS